MEDFLKYAQTKPSLLSYLPDQRDWYKLDKQWLCTVLSTIDSDGIDSMVSVALKKNRDKKM